MKEVTRQASTKMRCTDVLYIRARIILRHSMRFSFRLLADMLPHDYTVEPAICYCLNLPFSFSFPNRCLFLFLTLFHIPVTYFNPMLCKYSYCEYRTIRLNYAPLYCTKPLPSFSSLLPCAKIIWRYVFSISLLNFVFSYFNVTANQILYNPEKN